MLDDGTSRYMAPIAIDQRAEARRLQARYGVLVWWGPHTREFWAMVDRTRLVEGATPEALGQAILTARRWPT